MSTIQQLNSYKTALNFSIVDGLLANPIEFLEALDYISHFPEGKNVLRSVPFQVRETIEIKIQKALPLDEGEIEVLQTLQSSLIKTFEAIVELKQEGIDPEKKQNALEANTSEAIRELSVKPDSKTLVHESWKQTTEEIVALYIRSSKLSISKDQEKQLITAVRQLQHFSTTEQVFSYLDNKLKSQPVVVSYERSYNEQDKEKFQRLLVDANNDLAVFQATADVLDLYSQDAPPILDKQAGAGPFPDPLQYARAQKILNRSPYLRSAPLERKRLALQAVNAANLSQTTLPDSLTRNDAEISQLTLKSVLEQKLGPLNEDQLKKLVDVQNPEAVNKGIKAVLFIDAMATLQENKTTELARLFFESNSFDQFQKYLKSQGVDKNNASFLGITQELFSALTTASIVPQTNTFIPYAMGMYLLGSKTKKGSLIDQLLASRLLSQDSEQQLPLLEAAMHFVFASGHIKNPEEHIYVPTQFVLHFLDQPFFQAVAGKFFLFGEWKAPSVSLQEKQKFIRAATWEVNKIGADALSIVGQKTRGAIGSFNVFGFLRRILGRNTANVAVVATKTAISPVVLVVIAIVGVLAALIILPMISSTQYLQQVSFGESIQTGGGGGTNFNNFVCEADDPSCQPCDPTTESCSWPVNNGCITNGPGPQHNTSPGGTAIDINARFGTAVTATHDGVVVGFKFTDPENKFSSTPDYGNYVKIRGVRSGKTFFTIYSHLRPIDPIGMYNGLTISSGEVLGFVDNTGYSFGTHLHYEVIGLPLEALFPFPSTRGTCVNR